jgi:succinyl-diaminopimelate desuccinylase
MSETLDLAKDLISRASVTPEDEGCQDLMAERLSAVGFEIEHMPFENVKNLWARRGTAEPLFVFAGHTDVVPTGDVSKWTFDPFTPTEKDGQLYGRGAADMKGSVAAMVVASERFAKKHPDHKGSMAFLITADEEGDAYHGTEKVIAELEGRGDHVDYCLVGEPSSTTETGDTIKNGRRGSMLGYLTVIGKQGHVAYPHLARNPVHESAKAIIALTEEVWDNGNDFFPATSFQIPNMNSGTGATNVIPGDAEIMFSFRFSTEVTPEILQQRVRKILDGVLTDYELKFEVKGLPFLTDKGALVDAAVDAVKRVTDIDTELSTAGGTSDGRFIAPYGAQVLELGPVNATIHQIDENVNIADLDKLTDMYEIILENLLT